MGRRILSRFEYTGVIHVHSTYSDGSGSVPDILGAAQSAGLDFIVLTDHNTLRARTEGWEGWHGDVLLVVGEEITSREGHCLAVGATARVGRRGHRQQPERIIQNIREQDGLSFLAHPHGSYRPFFRRRDHSWRDWRVNSYTGIEVWSYMFDWVRDFRFYRWARHYRHPNSQIRGPFPETLSTWDRLCRKTRVVGIGGVDAHARRYPFLPFVVFPYTDLFSTLRTHVLTPQPLTGCAPGDIACLLRALQKGNCFISYDLLGNATGVRFGSVEGALQMGDEQPFAGPLHLEVHLPEKAELTVIRDGRPLIVRLAAEHRFCADAPGVYRVEARRNGKPWVYTNPIYLRG